MSSVLKPISIKLHEITSPIASEEESVKELGAGLRYHWRLANQSFLIDARKVDVITPRWWQWYFWEWMRAEDKGLQVPVTQWLFKDDYEVACAQISLSGLWVLTPGKRRGTNRYPYAVTGYVDGWTGPRLIGKIEPIAQKAVDYVLRTGRGTARDLSRELGISLNAANMTFNYVLRAGLLGFVTETKWHACYYVYTPPANDMITYNGEHKLRKRGKPRFTPSVQ